MRNWKVTLHLTLRWSATFNKSVIKLISTLGWYYCNQILHIKDYSLPDIYQHFVYNIIQLAINYALITCSLLFNFVGGHDWSDLQFLYVWSFELLLKSFTLLQFPRTWQYLFQFAPSYYTTFLVTVIISLSFSSLTYSAGK